MPVSGILTYELDSGEKRFIMKLTPKDKSDPKHLIRKETITIKVDWYILTIYHIIKK